MLRVLGNILCYLKVKGKKVGIGNVYHRLKSSLLFIKGAYPISNRVNRLVSLVNCKAIRQI